MATDPTGRISHVPEMHRGQSWKIAVRCATTASGTLASSFENGDTVDGLTLATGDRILIKNQASGSENGIYTVNASGAPTRAHDMDQDGATAVPATEVFGAVIWVVSGTTNAATLWYCTNTGSITLGSTSLTFAQFSGGGGGGTLAVADGGTGATTASGARTNLGLVIGTDVEAHDPDLTTIGGLSPSNDDLIQRKSGAWTNRTLAQLASDLSIAGGAGPTDYASGSSGSGHIVIPDLVHTTPAEVRGLCSWFAADHLTGFSDGDTVTQWPNSAPGIIGFDLTEAVGTPVYKTGILNSLPIVRFGGSAYWAISSLALMAESMSFFIVFKLSSIANAYSGILGYGYGDSGGFFIKSNGKSADYWGTAGNYDGTGSITYGTVNWNYVTNVHAYGAGYVRRNGSSDKSAIAWTYNSNTNYGYLGNQAVSSRVFSGDIAEVLIYSRTVLSSEVTTIESYLSTKYAL